MTATDLPVLRPVDPGYDDARLGFDRHAPHRPALVVTARDPDHVAAGVQLAAAQERRVVVQATGHGIGTTDPDAVLIDTSHLRDVVVDPATRTARVGAGVTNGELVAAAAPAGLAPLSGSAPGVGVVGYSLAGGLPLLGRAHGWAADRVRAVELVTADGEHRRLDLPATPSPPSAPSAASAGWGAGEPSGDAALAWALRGGGGSFGVVTALEVELIELRTAFGGQLVFDAGQAPALLRAWRGWAAAAPDALGTGIGIFPVPDVDGPPSVLRGRTVVAVQVAFDGPTTEGEATVAPLRRALGEPLLDGLRELAWTDSASIHADPVGPTSSVIANVALHELDDTVLDAALAPLGMANGDADGWRPASGPPRAVAFRRLGGALRHGVGPVRRDAEWLAGTVAIVPPRLAPDGVPAAEAFAAGWLRRMAPLAAGTIAGFLGPAGADPAQVRAAYAPQDWARLRAVKAAVDPDGRLLAAAPVTAAV